MKWIPIEEQLPHYAVAVILYLPEYDEFEFGYRIHPNGHNAYFTQMGFVEQWGLYGPARIKYILGKPSHWALLERPLGVEPLTSSQMFQPPEYTT